MYNKIMHAIGYGDLVSYEIEGQELHKYGFLQWLNDNT